MWSYSMADTSIFKRLKSVHVDFRSQLPSVIFTFLGDHTLVAESCSLKRTKNELQTTNTAHIQVVKSGVSIFPLSIHLSRLIPGKLSFIAKNVTKWFGKLLKPCQKCIPQKLNISHGLS